MSFFPPKLFISFLQNLLSDYDDFNLTCSGKIDLLNGTLISLTNKIFHSTFQRLVILWKDWSNGCPRQGKEGYCLVPLWPIFRRIKPDGVTHNTKRNRGAQIFSQEGTVFLHPTTPIVIHYSPNRAIAIGARPGSGGGLNFRVQIILFEPVQGQGQIILTTLLLDPPSSKFQNLTTALSNPTDFRSRPLPFVYLLSTVA